MLNELVGLLTRSKARKNWCVEEIAGFRVHAKIMENTMPKLEIYAGDKLVYHKSRSDVPVQEIPAHIVEQIVHRLEEIR